jgi:hypothetical protein
MFRAVPRRDAGVRPTGIGRWPGRAPDEMPETEANLKMRPNEMEHREQGHVGHE